MIFSKEEYLSRLAKVKKSMDQKIGSQNAFGQTPDKMLRK